MKSAYSGAHFKLLMVLTYWLLSSLYHLKFSLFIVNPINTPWGEVTLKHYGNPLFFVSLLVLCCFLLWRIKQTQQLIKSSLFWLLWFFAIYLNNHYLMATPIENIHFIQYALLSWLLLKIFYQAGKNQIGKILFWTTTLGMLDEILQYFYITKSYSSYLDFNDFLINLVAAIGGILVFFSYRNFQADELSIRSIIKSWEFKLSLFLGGSFAILIISAVLDIERKAHSFGAWLPDFFNGQYYVLAPLEGLSLMLITALIFIPFFTRIRYPFPAD